MPKATSDRAPKRAEDKSSKSAPRGAKPRRDDLAVLGELIDEPRAAISPYKNRRARHLSPHRTRGSLTPAAKHTQKLDLCSTPAAKHTQKQKTTRYPSS